MYPIRKPGIMGRRPAGNKRCPYCGKHMSHGLPGNPWMRPPACEQARAAEQSGPHHREP